VNDESEPGEERGQSFNLERGTYARLANCSMSLKRGIGIEPATLEHPPDGRPGCCLTLFGRHLAYTISIDAADEPASVSLTALQLDLVGEAPVTIIVGKPDGWAAWAEIADTIQRLEGRSMTYEAACELLRKLEP
jgi:hypothetical protein